MLSAGVGVGGAMQTRSAPHIDGICGMAIVLEFEAGYAGEVDGQVNGVLVYRNAVIGGESSVVEEDPETAGVAGVAW